LDFTEARDSEWQWHQLGHMQVCTSLQTDNHASTPHQAGCPSCHPTNSVKALKARALNSTEINSEENTIYVLQLTQAILQTLKLHVVESPMTQASLTTTESAAAVNNTCIYSTTITSVIGITDRFIHAKF